LRPRRHAGIRPARPGHVNPAAFNAADNLFENALNGGKARLHLPAMEIRAVIGQRNADTTVIYGD
jgi:hypothetical protein